MPEQPEISAKAQAMKNDLAKLPGRIDTYFSSYIDNNESIQPEDRPLAKYEAISSVVDLGSDLIRQSFTPKQKQELYASLTKLKDESLELATDPKVDPIKINDTLTTLQNKLSTPTDESFTSEDIQAFQKQGVATLEKITERINIVKNEIIEVKEEAIKAKTANPLAKFGKQAAQKLNSLRNTIRASQNPSTTEQAQQRPSLLQRRPSNPPKEITF